MGGMGMTDTTTSDGRPVFCVAATSVLHARYAVPEHGPAVVLKNRGALETTLSPQENKKHAPRGRGRGAWCVCVCVCD